MHGLLRQVVVKDRLALPSSLY